MSDTISLERHHSPKDFSDRIAYAFTRFLRFFADTFFAKRYGHRAVVLETVAAVPGMVAGTLNTYMPCVAWKAITGGSAPCSKKRMHLMTFVEIAQPSWLERWLILLAQGIFYNFFFLLYLCSSKTAHRVVGYFEEEAVYSYTEY